VSRREPAPPGAPPGALDAARPGTSRPDAARAGAGGAAGRSAAASLRLVRTAEKLFAEHGLDGVSLRQISAAAGHGNNNAVQYHFGSKQGLIRAILAHRLPRIDHRRAALLAAATSRGHDRDTRTLLDVLIRPLAEETQDPESSYVGFLSRVSHYPPDEHPWWITGQPASEVAYRVIQALLAHLSQLPEPLRMARIRHATNLCLHALAGRDRPAGGAPLDPPLELFVADLLDVATAALLASPSVATRRQLDTLGQPVDKQLT
jgi:AcrR family transcriptional regulator